MPAMSLPQTSGKHAEVALQTIAADGPKDPAVK